MIVQICSNIIQKKFTREEMFELEIAIHIKISGNQLTPQQFPLTTKISGAYSEEV